MAGCRCCPKDPVTRFRNVIALWVLIATTGVSVVVWLFIKNATSTAVDKLAWRMTGVVRVLSKEQAQSLFLVPVQAVKLASVANLADLSSINYFTRSAFYTTAADSVKVGLDSNNLLLSYTRLLPGPNSRITLQLSSGSANSTNYTQLVSYSVLNETHTEDIAFDSQPYNTRAQDWYTSAVAQQGVGYWTIGGDTIPIITYAMARYNTSAPTNPKPLLGVIASELIVAKFLDKIVGFLANVSPKGQIFICTDAGVPLLASGNADPHDSPLVNATLQHVYRLNGGSQNLNTLPIISSLGGSLSKYEVTLLNDKYYVLWDNITISNLNIYLVMTLNRGDFMEEIDSSYKQLGIVIAFAGPVIVVLTFALSSFLVGIFVNTVLKSLQESVLAASDDPDEEEDEDSDADSRMEEEDEIGDIVGPLRQKHVRKTSALQNAVKSFDQTPMMSVINILTSLRGSLPTNKRWMLDKILRQLTHAKEGDLYTPYAISRQDGEVSSSAEDAGIMAILRPTAMVTTNIPFHGRDSAQLFRHYSSQMSDDMSPIAYDERRRASAIESDKSIEELAATKSQWATTMKTMPELETYIQNPGPITPPMSTKELMQYKSFCQGIEEWSFDIFYYSEAVPMPLRGIVLVLMERLGLMTVPPMRGKSDSGGGAGGTIGNGKVPISWETACAYFETVEKGYLTDIQYHTAIHAADTVHGCHYFLTRLGMDRFVQFTPLEQFALLFSAAVHDLRHPGVNNNFLITTSHPLAIRYNDKSVLENFHIATAFQLMKHEGRNLLEHLETPDANYVRNLAVTIVLATDLALSFDIIGKFKVTFQNKDLKLEGDKEIKEGKEMLLKMAMKCCDVASGTKSIPLHKKFTALVTDEFFYQGDMEKKLGLPVAPFMDRVACNLAKSQQGFLTFVVKPIYGVIADTFPAGQLFMDNLTANMDDWKRIELIEAEAAAAKEAATAGLKSPSAASVRNAVRPLTAGRPASKLGPRPPTTANKSRVMPAPNAK